MHWELGTHMRQPAPHLSLHSGTALAHVTEDLLSWQIQGTLSRHHLVTGSRPVCLALQKAKTQSVRAWSKERFIGQEGTDWDNRTNGASNPSSESPEFRLLSVKGRTGVARRGIQGRAGKSPHLFIPRSWDSGPLLIWVRSWGSYTSLINPHGFAYLFPPIQEAIFAEFL